MKNIRSLAMIVWSIASVLYVLFTNQTYFESIVIVGFNIVMIGVNEVIEMLGRPIEVTIEREKGDK